MVHVSQWRRPGPGPPTQSDMGEEQRSPKPVGGAPSRFERLFRGCARSESGSPLRVPAESADPRLAGQLVAYRWQGYIPSFEEGSPRRSNKMQRYLSLGVAGEVELSTPFHKFANVILCHKHPLLRYANLP